MWSIGNNINYRRGTTKYIVHLIIYCDVPGSLFLSKTGQVYGPFFFYKFLGSIKVCSYIYVKLADT